MPNNMKKILIVDDEADFVRSTSHRLAFEGFEVMEASSAEEALAIMERTLPDLVLLDVMMPGMNGVEMFEEMRRNDRLKKVPVIFLTVWDQLIPNDSKRHPAPAILVTKPFDFNTLTGAIRTALSQATEQGESKG